MGKISTRIKRKLGLSSHRPFPTRPLVRDRPKTFLTEESANNWAKKNNLEKFDLIKVKKGKRYQVVKN